MGKWILLVGGGVVIAVVIGLLANSQSASAKQYCDSLSSLESSVTSLTSLNPSSATQDDFQSDVSAVQSAWSDVKSDAQQLQDVNMDALDSAWDDFSQAVKGVTSSSSVSDAEDSISQSADALASTAQSNIKSYDCSDSSSS